MRVKHVMTKDPSACVPSDSAQHAARIMREQDAGIIPVIDNGAEPEGRRRCDRSRSVHEYRCRWSPSSRRERRGMHDHEGRDLLTKRFHQQGDGTHARQSDSARHSRQRVGAVAGHRRAGGRRRARRRQGDADARDLEKYLDTERRAEQAARAVAEGCVDSGGESKRQDQPAPRPRV